MGGFMENRIKIPEKCKDCIFAVSSNEDVIFEVSSNEDVYWTHTCGITSEDIYAYIEYPEVVGDKPHTCNTEYVTITIKE
jgi:hypothetical protein